MRSSKQPPAVTSSGEMIKLNKCKVSGSNAAQPENREFSVVVLYLQSQDQNKSVMSRPLPGDQPLLQRERQSR